MDGDSLVTLTEVCRRVSLSRKTIWRLRRANAFPQPVVIRGRALWSELEVGAWIERQLASRPPVDAIGQPLGAISRTRAAVVAFFGHA